MPKPPVIPNELFAYERMKHHWTQGDVADNIGAPDVKTIGRWERGEVAPSPYYQGKLAEVFGKSARALGFPPDGQISFWHVPYRRNAYFTGRDDILQQLRDTLLAQHASPVPRLPLALSGLGGVGKSQIALEYAYRYREHYHTVLWLHATSYQDLVADVTAVADLLDLPGKDTANPAQRIETLKEWLTQLTRWLLIFDNIEDLQLLEGFLPAEIKGHLLLMTRSQSTGTHAHRIAVEPMGSDTGAELLLRRAKLIAIESTLEHMAAAEAATARSLSEDMGGLPLALDQAGAYIEEKDMSLSEYVQRYHAERRKLLHRRGARVSEHSEHPEPVAVTLGLSIDSAGEQHPLATDILNFCVFLAPDAIPEELFQHDESFKYGTTVFDEAIAALLRYSLIKRNTQDKTFSMHRLVQAVLIDAMPPDLQKHWRERVWRALDTAFPATDLFNLGLSLLYQGQYSEGQKLITQASAIHLHYFGVDHHNIASITSRGFNTLACDYLKQGEYTLAEPLFQQAIAISEEYLGAEHPSTCTYLYNLAVFYMHQDNYGQAEPLLERVLYIRNKLLGAEHPDTVESLKKLARVYYEQSKYEQAELLYQRLLRLFEQQLGTEHPEVALPLYALAMVMQNQGQHKQADALYKRALSILEPKLEPTHPQLQVTRMAYAKFLLSIGRDAEAPELAMYFRLFSEPSV